VRCAGGGPYPRMLACARADILACSSSMTIMLFCALTFSALLHVCIACTCSLPGC
jgi:hypothetical protein